MKVLVLGGSGMLGHRLAGSLVESGHEVAVTVRREDLLVRAIVPRAIQLPGVVAESPETVAAAMRSFRPDAVVNCIGIVKQMAEAKAAVPSIQVNSLFPHQVAALCADAGARFAHVSTDCVFTGARGPEARGAGDQGAYSLYAEDDTPDAADLYGRSKLLGEVGGAAAVNGSGAGAVTVRTSIIGWELRNPTGLLSWFAAHAGGDVAGYRRAVFSGLSTAELSRVIERLLGEWAAFDGLWHVSAEPIDKYSLLERLDARLGWGTRITPVDEPAIDRSLSSARFREAAGWVPPSWDAMLDGLAAEWERYREPLEG